MQKLNTRGNMKNTITTKKSEILDFLTDGDNYTAVCNEFDFVKNKKKNKKVIIRIAELNDWEIQINGEIFDIIEQISEETDVKGFNKVIVAK